MPRGDTRSAVPPPRRNPIIVYDPSMEKCYESIDLPLEPVTRDPERESSTTDERRRTANTINDEKKFIQS